ncbi:MAG: calcium-binding protein [Geminicoccaceae bacterium]
MDDNSRWSDDGSGNWTRIQFGSRRAEEIIGTDDDDLLIGRRGDDDLIGGEGDDGLFGGRGDDDLFGDAGEDLVVGGRGDDLLRGGADDDRLIGGRGDDLLIGDTGDDFIAGGRGDDISVWNNGDGSDLISGGGGHDRQQVNLADGGNDVATIAEARRGVAFERDAFESGAGAFALDIRTTETLEVNGNGGDDMIALVGDIIQAIDLELNGGADTADDAPAVSAADIATGDTLDLGELDTGVLVDLDENNQGVLQPADENSDSTAPGLSDFGFLETADGDRVEILDDFENVVGTAYNDTIFGNIQNNVLLGGDGDDALHPFGGTDFVDGGGGTDILFLQGFGVGQFVDFEAGVAGNLNETGDGIAEGASINTFINFENVNGSSVGGDVILGDAGDNGLNGLGGDDVLVGNAGSDTMSGGDGADTFVLGDTGNGDVDTIIDFEVGIDVLQLDDLLQGFDAGTELEAVVALEDNGTDTIVQVGTDESGFTDLAVLTGVTGTSLETLIDAPTG